MPIATARSAGVELSGGAGRSFREDRLGMDRPPPAARRRRAPFVAPERDGPFPGPGSGRPRADQRASSSPTSTLGEMRGARRAAEEHVPRRRPRPGKARRPCAATCGSGRRGRRRSSGRTSRSRRGARARRAAAACEDPEVVDGRARTGISTATPRRCSWYARVPSILTAGGLRNAQVDLAPERLDLVERRLGVFSTTSPSPSPVVVRRPSRISVT